VRRVEKMKITEVLRLSEMGMSQREIAAGTGCGKSTVGDLLKLCKDKSVTFENASNMSDEALQNLLYPHRQSAVREAQIPDWNEVSEELAKHKNLNLRFMWEEYLMEHPAGLSYSQFCRLYREYREEAGRSVSLYYERKAGELMEVDWAGDKLACVRNYETGELVDAHFFISVLGYSLYPYVEAFPDEKEPAWITAHVNALHYYGGVPRVIAPDNCKTAVVVPKYYEPVINSAYWELAQHYKLAIVPARIRKPKDKPAVEGAVRWIETWLLGKLRKQIFFSFAELNTAVRKYLDELSAKPFQKREGSRYSEYIRIDKPTLRPLPSNKYEIADVRSKSVGDNYHLEYDGFHYSVPYTLHKEDVVLRATSTSIEVLDKDRIRVASHARRYIAAQGRYVTNMEHMPPNHKFIHQQRQFDGKRYRNWAKKIGGNTYFVIDNILNAGAVEEQGFKSCMAILQFSKKHGYFPLELACKQARESGFCTYSAVKSALMRNTTKAPITKATPNHENIRGSGYYH